MTPLRPFPSRKLLMLPEIWFHRFLKMSPILTKSPLRPISPSFFHSPVNRSCSMPSISPRFFAPVRFMPSPSFAKKLSSGSINGLMIFTPISKMALIREVPTRSTLNTPLRPLRILLSRLFVSFMSPSQSLNRSIKSRKPFVISCSLAPVRLPNTSFHAALKALPRLFAASITP